MDTESFGVEDINRERARPIKADCFSYDRHVLQKAKCVLYFNLSVKDNLAVSSNSTISVILLQEKVTLPKILLIIYMQFYLIQKF